MKRSFVKGAAFLCVGVLMLTGCGAKETSDAQVEAGEEVAAQASSSEPASPIDEVPFDYLAMDIYECSYGDEFEMSKNLRQALSDYIFIKNLCSPSEYTGEGWKSTFLQWFISNECDVTLYESKLISKDGYNFTKDQIEYIQHSLTGKYVSFDEYFADSDTLDCSYVQPMAPTYTLDITSQVDDGDAINLELNAVNKSGKEIPVIAKLYKNPYSCYDGYSIVELSIKGDMEFSEEEKTMENNGNTVIYPAYSVPSDYPQLQAAFDEVNGELEKIAGEILASGNSQTLSGIEFRRDELAFGIEFDYDLNGKYTISKFNIDTQEGKLLTPSDIFVMDDAFYDKVLEKVLSAADEYGKELSYSGDELRSKIKEYLESDPRDYVMLMNDNADIFFYNGVITDEKNNVTIKFDFDEDADSFKKDFKVR
ncbi:hypothetical protein [Butyrivibrio sp. VCB2006]|uniref:hypothetical protein n=1 Tax=Butyrivibrio sp. VCB2006 TaxID=1280679 RepID=UPI000426F90B|nr:hypothetical protein [Butyrivibrio sp. VCB2006]